MNHFSKKPKIKENTMEQKRNHERNGKINKEKQIIFSKICKQKIKIIKNNLKKTF